MLTKASKIYNLEHISKVDTYVWRSQWIQYYESPWGILEKFRFSNNADEKDMLEIFLNPRKKMTKGVSKKLRDLIRMDGLCTSRLETVLGINIKEINHNYISNLLNNLPGQANDYMQKELKYCPVCIRYGHHSIFHQVVSFNRCPYHLIPLQINCPNCNGAIPYELSYNWSKEAFMCNCGYSFVDKSLRESFVPLWNKSILKPRAPEVLSWLDLSIRHKETIHNMYIFRKNLIDYRHEIIEKLLSLFNLNNDLDFSKNPHIIKSTYYFSRTNKSIINSIEELETDLNESAKPIFKAIARFYRKSLRNHKKYIKSFALMQEQSRVCPSAYAYLMWRKDIEGKKSYGDKIKLKDSPFFDFAFEIQFSVLDNSKMSKYRMYESLKWVFNRVFAFIVINHFKFWLEVADDWSKRRLLYMSLPLEKQKYPFFIVVLPENKDKTIKFIWWDEQMNLYDKLPY